MHCLRCNAEFSDEFFLMRSQSKEFDGGRFACPDCGAEHIRRGIGQLPSGKPLFTLRLWGHPTTTRPSPAAAGGEGRERRSRVRVKPPR